MFDKLDGILERYKEIMDQLNDPNVVSDQANFRKLMKEQSDLAPIVELYKKRIVFLFLTKSLMKK